MKAAHKTQNRAETGPKRWRGTAAGKALVFLGLLEARGYSPEAEEVLDILESRIVAAQAGQASRDAFLEGLDPASGCADWAAGAGGGGSADKTEAAARWQEDPEVRAAVEQACPRYARKPGRNLAGAAGLSAAQGVRPRQGEQPLPALAASWHRPRGGLEAASGSGGIRRRRIWLRGQGWSVQAGSLAFSTASPAFSSTVLPGLSAIPAVLVGLPFVAGGRTFRGNGGRSGVEGPWESRSSALDGLGMTVGGKAWRISAFGSWNRFGPAGKDEGAGEGRRDALAHSVAAAGTAGGWDWIGQAAHARLEPPAGPPATAITAGGGLRHGSRRFRLGWAGSGHWPRGGPFEGGGAGRPSGAGAYGEIALSEGKPGGYLLEVRQATPGWAGPLSGARTFARDTLGEGLILPGRGEGGFLARSGAEILREARFRLGAEAAGEADWIPDGLLAGEGRLALTLAWGEWNYRTACGLGWRTGSLPAPGGSRSLGHTLERQGGSWRHRASLTRRMTRRLAGPGDRTVWPASLETAFRPRGSGSWSLGLASGNILDPGEEFRLSAHQRWRVGEGVFLSHGLRLPVDDGKVRKDMGYRLRLDIAGL